VSWKSANEQVATISNDGIVTGINPGKATITALAEGKQGITRITVVPVCTEIVTLPDDRPPTPTLVWGHGSPRQFPSAGRHHHIHHHERKMRCVDYY
jgi:hypothetical protein